jgi:hypothetical protein
MALLAESLVEEWLNRQGFFTIRGIKQRISEIDLLAIRPTDSGLVGWHVEVQVSFRPVSYICKLPKDVSRATGIARTSAKLRSSDEIGTCARDWVEGKYKSPDKQRLRNQLWPGVDWSFHLVHGVVKDESELAAIKACGVTLSPFHKCLFDLCERDDIVAFSGSAGGDLAEVVRYYRQKRALDEYR